MADLAPNIFAAHWMRQLGAGEYVYSGEPRLADVRPLAPKRAEAFVSVEIEQQQFHGIADAGALFLEDARHDRLRLGVAVITTIRGDTTAADENSALARNWMLASRHGAGRVCLAKHLPLSEHGRQALAHTFGLPMLPLMPAAIRHQVEPRHYFYLSPACAALREWLARLPGAPLVSADDDPLGDWAAAPLIERAA